VSLGEGEGGVCRDKGPRTTDLAIPNAPIVGDMTKVRPDWWTNVNHEALYGRVEKPQAADASEAFKAQSGQALTNFVGKVARRFTRLSNRAFVPKGAKQCYECIVTPN
jgi:hypothetical protein